MTKHGTKNGAPFRRELGDGLVLKTAADEADVHRVADFDAEVFGEEGEQGVGDFCRMLFLYHPNTQPGGLIFVEDENTGKIVSSLCLIPSRWSYEDVTLKTGEMGIVATRKEYRRRGLIRAQADYLKELLAEGEFDLSQIQGIPYFYRQFGYEYAIPLTGGHGLEMHQIPDQREGETVRFSCREETADDMPALQRLYDEAANDLAIHTRRDNAIWQYLSGPSQATTVAYEGWIVEDSDGKIAGYFRIQRQGFGAGFIVYEVSRLSYDAAIAAMRHLKKLAVESGKPYIRLYLPADCTLVKTAGYYGARDLGHYAWQIHVPDMARFFRTISPVLERRLADSPFAGLTEELKFNFYCETISLNLKDGHIVDIKSSRAGGASINIPPRAAVPLVLGYRDRKELRESWPDLNAPPREAYIIDVLFPKMRAHIYTNY